MRFFIYERELWPVQLPRVIRLKFIILLLDEKQLKYTYYVVQNFYVTVETELVASPDVSERDAIHELIL